MTTNEEIIAAADRLAETIRSRYNDELYHTHIIYQEHLWRAVDETADTMHRAIAIFAEYNADAVANMHASLEHIFGGSFTNPLADPARGYIDDVASYITDWYGTAAEAFRMNFLNPYPEIRHNQVALVRELALVLEAYQAMVDETRAKAVMVANQAVAALNSLGTPAAIPLSIAAAVVAVVAAAATATGVGAAVVAVGFALVGGGLSVASTVASETPTPSDALIQGGNVREVVSTIWEALHLVRQDRNNAEAKLVAALEFDLALVERERALADAREVNLLIPYQPRIIDAMQGEEVDFRLSTGS